MMYPWTKFEFCSYFAGQLGDGRAISLFETENKKGERWELQLKGAGRTPYSRFADGYAVLRSSIREFLGSEHMAALGVPTSRALNLILTDREVYRDDAPSGEKMQTLQ
jgi:serine/tyrosine/threonine adenylyltransferase